MEKVSTITVKEASKMLNKGQEFLRATLRQGKVNWGWAVQNEKGRWNYIILKEKFLKYIDQ